MYIRDNSTDIASLKCRRNSATPTSSLRRSLMIIRRRDKIRCKILIIQSYSNRRFQILKLYYDLVLDVMIWGWKMPASLWYMCESWLGFIAGIDPRAQPEYPYFSDVLQAMMFLFIYQFASKAFTIGWELFESFDVKERHGFNKMTMDLYIKDEVKSIILWTIFGAPAFWLIMLVIEWGGDLLFLWLLILSISFIFIFKYLYINIIGPMYNKYEPIKEGSLKEELKCLCRDAGFPIEKIYIVDQSKRSGHSNAMITGIGKHQQIIIYDTLLKPEKEGDKQPYTD